MRWLRNTLVFTACLLCFVTDTPSSHFVVIRAQQAEKARTFALLKSVLAEEQKRRAAERYDILPPVFLCTRHIDVAKTKWVNLCGAAPLALLTGFNMKRN